MSNPTHRGFEFSCDGHHEADDKGRKFLADSAQTERTAIDHARDGGWFVGRIRIMSGGQGGRRVVLCQWCKWLVGA